MRVLVTGGCGFLGAHIVEHLLKHTDAEVVVLDRLSYASSGFDRLRDIAAFDDARVFVLTADLAAPVSEGIVQELGHIDYIVHAAAETHVNRSIDDPLPFINANVLGTHNILMLARKLKGLQRIFMVSTDEVYGPAAWDAPGFDVDARFRPGNPYAAAKAGGECLAFAYANTFKVPVTIVNTMNLIGERQHPEKFVPLVIKRVLDGGLLQIHADAKRERSGTRFYLHCRTFASALTYLMTNIMAKVSPPEKVHVVGEREISNLDLALLIADVVDRPLHYELVDFHSSRPGHDLRYALDGSSMMVLGWKHPVSIEQSLEKTVRWFLDPANRRWLEWK